MRYTSRRRFLRNGLLLAGGAGVSWAALHRFSQRRRPAADHPDLGPLRPVPDAATGLPLLWLPEGFRYTTMGWAGQIMSDGFATPTRADGMGVTGQQGDRVTLVRNHELRGSHGPFGDPATAYDVTGGGTTTLVFNTATESLEESFVSLNGTLNNCAGGVTPWGTWLSCEEAPLTPTGVHHGLESRQSAWGIENARRKHGYVFEVDPRGVSEPQPLVDMGQFYHEAVAVTPDGSVLYQTEDRQPYAGLYRFLPNSPGVLADGGRLQMMRVEGLDEWIHEARLFQPRPYDWVDIERPDEGDRPGTHDNQGVVAQGMAAGGTAFRSLEGCALEGNDLFFTSKNGGRFDSGLVFHADTRAGTVQAIWESPGDGALTGPDNIIVSPRGGLMICEDNESSINHGQQVSVLDREGRLWAFLRFNPDIAGSYLGHDL
ncbi:MAG: DUF839 domain-containing protein, partial [Xanthomonadales bacterium]|nr:DUF839 domain-containing protein [Xanthomonadales bacterium]